MHPSNMDNVAGSPVLSMLATRHDMIYPARLQSGEKIGVLHVTSFVFIILKSE